MSQLPHNGGVGSGRRFDDVFKRHAVALMEDQGRKVTEVARELGVSTFSLHAWKREYGRPRGVGAAAPTTMAELQAENERLRTDNERLRQREEVLKKTLGILSEPLPNASRGSRR
jgi:transposase